ncbi:hypothetical protein FRC08_013338, partial [Ceratobasidium sp. 394]
PVVLHLEEGIEELGRQHREGEVLSLLADEGTSSLEGAAASSPVAVVGVIGRGRGSGFQPGGRDSGNEYEEQRNRLLEPITFVRAELTARTLFEEEEEIFKPEVVDTEQGDNIPTADFVEAAFASQQDAEESDEESNPDETDLQDTAATNVDPTGSYTPVASSSKQVPKLDISSAVSLATAFKDAALTPREEHFTPISPALSKAITEEKMPPNLPTSDSDSESEDVVLFVPQPRTPLRSMTPLPLLAAPGPMLGVNPSPIRPSPLATSFRPPLREDEEAPEDIPEATGPKFEAAAETTNDTDMKVAEEAKPTDKGTTTTSDADIPSINFEDLSSIMFVDTTPTPVVLPSKAKLAEETREHIPSTGSAKYSPPPAPNFHDMKFDFTGRSTTPQATKQAAASERVIQDTSTVVETTEIATTTTPAKPPTPNFHTMTFTFTRPSAASRSRKPPPGDNRRGLGFKPKRTPRVPREGDSDLDWGDEGPPKPKAKASKAKEDEDSDGDHGMLEDVDSATMLKFLKSVEAQEWVTMDDIKDEEMLRQEDEDDEENGSGSGESDEDEDEDSDEYVDEDEEALNRIIAAAEAEFVDSDEDSDDDMDESFGTRLARMRQSAGSNGKGKAKKGKGKGKGRDDDSDDDEIQMSGFSWAEKDEAYIAAIQVRLILVHGYPLTHKSAGAAGRRAFLETRTQAGYY